jgi:hypothetical protein
MSTSLTTAIVRAKCSATKAAFGIRLDQAASSWVAAWAFPLNQGAAPEREHPTTRLNGQITCSDNYPGCPNCKAESFFLCGCGKVGCWDGESSTVTCPWCDQTAAVGGTLESLDAGEDC